MNKCLVILAALLLCGCTITMQLPAAAISPLATATSTVLPSPTATATATITPTAPLSPTVTATSTATPTATPTPILAPGIVPAFPAEGYPKVDIMIFLISQSERIHFKLEPNGDYDVQGSPSLSPENGDVVMSLCQYDKFKWELGYERPSASRIAENREIRCPLEASAPAVPLRLLNRLMGHAISEKGNLYDYFEAPPTMTPTQSE